MSKGGRDMARERSSGGGPQLFSLERGPLRVRLTNFGAAVFSVELRDASGNWEDVALTCDSLESFVKNRNYYGATVGRTANRIRGGRAVIGGRAVQLEQNENGNSAHGGSAGFAWRCWEAEAGTDRVLFRLLSRDGEAGYPGNLEVEAEYRLDGAGALCITHRGLCDQDTILNLTNHTYWCLGGLGEKIYEQELFVNGRFYLETDEALLPTGQILSVAGTPFDFTVPRKIGRDILADHPALRRDRGYDVSYVREDRGMGLGARLSVPGKGRTLEMETTLPDVHIYTGNFLNQDPGKGRLYTPHDAICLEAQRFPDAVNYPHFGPIFLRAGERYHEEIRYRFFFPSE